LSELFVARIVCTADEVVAAFVVALAQRFSPVGQQRRLAKAAGGFDEKVAVLLFSQQRIEPSQFLGASSEERVAYLRSLSNRSLNRGVSSVVNGFARFRTLPASRMALKSSSQTGYGGVIPSSCKVAISGAY